MPAITVEQALELARTYHQSGLGAAAEATCQQILAVQPDHPDALYRLGLIARTSGHDEQASKLIVKAIARGPARAVYYSDLGVIYRRMGRLAEALTCYRAALELEPNASFMHFNLGNLLHVMGRIDEAIVSYRRSLALDPNLADAHWNLALMLLLVGRYGEGWTEHEWRWRCSGYAAHRRAFTVPQWNGDSAAGQVVLVHAEAGFGDTVQFLRYVRFVRQRSSATRVILECQPQLARLLASSGDWEAEVIPRGDQGETSLPPFDLHVPLLSLPLALRLFTPQDPCLPLGPYVRSDPVLRDGWRVRMGSGVGFRVGLAWAGNTAHEQNHLRSLEFEELFPILRVPGSSFYSLQLKGDGSQLAQSTHLIDLTAEITDFADTAALVAELDLIISVDTAVAHLAGAMGKPVWTLLPFVPDWRWGFEGEQTPWYPTMRLFRQPAIGDWASVIQRVAGELQDLVAAKCG